jgi:hypothetical protein
VNAVTYEEGVHTVHPKVLLILWIGGEIRPGDQKCGLGREGRKVRARRSPLCLDDTIAIAYSSMQYEYIHTYIHKRPS